MKRTFLFLAVLLVCQLQAQVSNKPIHVSVTGSGAPIILIPGFSVPGESWDSTVSKLKKNYECHTVTLAGFGGAKPIDFPWLPKINKAIEDYINDNNLNNVTIIGHSLGGTIATWLASRGNNKISRIILIDALPAAGALMFPNFSPDSLKYDNPYSNQQLAMNDEQFGQMAAFMAKGMSLNSDAQTKIKEWILKSDRKTYVYGYTDYLKLDMREGLKNITVPVTIIAADKPRGKEMVEKTYKSQYANLANYEFIIAENSAHFIMFDKPEWFINKIKKTLESK